LRPRGHTVVAPLLIHSLIAHYKTLNSVIAEGQRIT